VTDDPKHDLSLDDLVSESDTHWEDVMNREMGNWNEAIFPYDYAECGCCATQHATRTGFCDCRAHAEMRREARELELGKLKDENSPKFRETVLAFREKYARFYAPR
jgi:hypothetical protein